ncbi:hypothetical protein JB92DRAFT_1615254 [Gautieria morchelliformis]|nr:hypothetical protein JB92DRAFT_1615254 [Gautieria morchelliformis]
MPEQQASPSSSRPPSTQEKEHEGSPEQDHAAATQSSKRTYLSLLPPPQLIDLILAIDSNRQALIFPHDLASAIKALQRPQRQSQSPSSENSTGVAVVVKAEPASSSVPPPVPPPPQNHPPLAQSPVVQPPQYKPPAYKQPSHGYPYTHTPYYSPTQPPQPPSQGSAPLPPPSAPPARHPLFTSAPLTRDPNKPQLARPTPAPVVSSRDDPNAMPSYEEMIVEAIVDVGDGEGTPPKILFAWMASHYPLQQNFRPSASQALHKALKRGRLEKIGGKYRLNPSWGGGPTVLVSQMPW